MVYRTLRPLLFRLDAERAHDLALASAARAGRLAGPVIRRLFRAEYGPLRQQLWGLEFANPVGIAAGLDKNARLLPFWELLGLGTAEVGSVTANPSGGNRRPRAFRLPNDRALVNRMGLNNEGAAEVAARIAGVVERGIPLGINLAKTHDPAILGDEAVEDFLMSFRTLAPLADYIVLNVSCPNTAEGKTFEEPEALDALLRAVFSERERMDSRVPVLVKFSPPPADGPVPSSVDELVHIALAHGVSGFVAVNTAADRHGLRTSPGRIEEIGRGGLSGAPLAGRARSLLKHLYQITSGSVPLVSVGGIDSPEEAYRRIRLGASLIQVYTGLVYEGPGLIPAIKKGLAALLDRDGFATLSDAVGADV